MTAIRDADTCLRLERWLTAYVDDELDAVHTLDVEEHIEACACCREQIDLVQAVRNSLCSVAPMKAPSSLRERISAVMVEERKAEDEQAKSLPQIGGASEPGAEKSATDQRLVKLRYVVPLAAAATLVLVIGAVSIEPAAKPSASPKASDGTGVPAQAASTFEKFLDDLVAAHAQPPPPEVTSYDDLGRFDPYVGVRIPRPQLTSVGAQFKGGRMHSRTAMLQYLLRKRHRVTVYVFDSKRTPVRCKRLRARRYGDHNVFVGHVRGYTVAATERNGIGWALASGLRRDESAELLMMAAR